ncbi:MAG: SpoIID/LytB domain-containing protein [Acidobacteriota bacterium]
MIGIDAEPTIAVGIVTGAPILQFSLEGTYRLPNAAVIPGGTYRAWASEGSIVLESARGERTTLDGSLKLKPNDGRAQSFVVASVQIGIGFHWQRAEDQKFTGDLELIGDAGGRLTLINIVGVEDYLASVISSEMSATSHPELLKAHAITSRSWLLAQLDPWKVDRGGQLAKAAGPSGELIRWYDRENHAAFDVCADDHCQRYQGMTKATTDAVSAAVNATWGRVLTCAGEMCDARFSKSCGGMTEDYRAAWQDIEIPYLSARVDAERWPKGFRGPLTDEVNARAWILGSPQAFCNSRDSDLLAKILPGFDQETVDFYRWRRRITQEELQGLIERKLGTRLGAISSLRALERGRSGRIIRLAIAGELSSLILGKELEIRRALSESHLYSSAFIVDQGPRVGAIPAWFELRGAGWGHGVGLCQIGAAAMAEAGLDAKTILDHYFLNTELEQLYPERRR